MRSAAALALAVSAAWVGPDVEPTGWRAKKAPKPTNEKRKAKRKEQRKSRKINRNK